MTDKNGHINFVNPAALNLLGYDLADLLGKDAHALFHQVTKNGELLTKDKCPIARSLYFKRDYHSDDEVFLKKDKTELRVSVNCRPLIKNDQVIGNVIAFQDVTERKIYEEKIQQLAFYDPLTNLPNRRLLMDRLDQLIIGSRRHKYAIAVLVLDLDKFKSINDTLGHDCGDLLLREVGARLTLCTRAEDTVSRQGGDEFIIILSHLGTPKNAEFVAEKCIAQINKTFVFDKQNIEIGISIGIAFADAEHLPDKHDLLKRADLAMYEAKKEGGNTYRFYKNSED